ncbi:hypothetical protein AC239_35450 [Bacteroides fragilis]|nr:hypothetical protein M134_0760 [Bacteroides fragilis str. S24L34]OCR38816.1 hypothetical protein AC239_35450 [Bacteroides fragilis]
MSGEFVQEFRDNKPPKHPARNVLNFMVLYVYFNWLLTCYVKK